MPAWARQFRLAFLSAAFIALPWLVLLPERASSGSPSGPTTRPAGPGADGEEDDKDRLTVDLAPDWDQMVFCLRRVPDDPLDPNRDDNTGWMGSLDVHLPPEKGHELFGGKKGFFDDDDPTGKLDDWPDSGATGKAATTRPAGKPAADKTASPDEREEEDRRECSYLCEQLAPILNRRANDRAFRRLCGVLEFKLPPCRSLAVMEHWDDDRGYLLDRDVRRSALSLTPGHYVWDLEPPKPGKIGEVYYTEDGGEGYRTKEELAKLIPSEPKARAAWLAEQKRRQQRWLEGARKLHQKRVRDWQANRAWNQQLGRIVAQYLRDRKARAGEKTRD